VAFVAAPLLVGVLLSVLLIANQRQRAQLQADASVRASVALAVTQVRTEVRNELSAAAAVPTAADVTIPVAQAATSAASPDGLIQARDTGAATLDDTAKPASIIVPIYAAGQSHGTTAQRRAAISSYRLVPLALRTVLTGLAPEHGGIAVEGPNRPVIAVPSAAPASARTFAVDMDLTDSPGWVVAGWVPGPGTPGITWFWIVGFLAVFGAVSVALAILLRREVAATSRQTQMERERSLVTGLAPVLQASLDIGEVVPAVSSHLVQGLSLAGLSLSTPSDSGERQVFSWGTPPDASVRPSVTRPAHLDSGITYALSLTRGGRVMGILRVRAGEPLTRNDLLALATASELFGSTLANAEAFARQQDLVERMRSVDELKTVFLATASHELRTPVTAIVGFSSLLLEHWNDTNAQGRQLMERVLSNGRRLETLIEQLLDFSQLERGLPRNSDELLDLGRTVEKILSDQPELAAGHQLSTFFADGSTVRGSRAAVERIVTNLVGNAAKYSPQGTRITVTVRVDKDRAILFVDDEGSGVPEADRERVFSRFYRGRGDSVTRTRGAGIGLAIVAEYAASISGTVSVQTAPSGGARFTVSFPAVGALVGAQIEGVPDVAHS
jgi:signal transduction histidine kinase